MIQTRLSIFKSLQKKIRELTKHGKLDPVGFKTIIYGVVLNDMIEWAQYKPDVKNLDKLKSILENYILKHKDFQIERIIENENLYVNTNTPQDNTTWDLLADNQNNIILTSDQVTLATTQQTDS